MRNDTGREGIPYCDPAGRNLRDVWTITTKPYREAHFATFSPELPKRCILAGTSERGVCPKCGTPWKRVMEKTGEKVCSPDAYGRPRVYQCEGQVQEKGGGKGSQGFFTNVTRTLGWRPGCECQVLVPKQGLAPDIVAEIERRIPAPANAV